ncbi:MAG TPA: GNAT family N-acetyltransferase [Candidatus Deferrimicrobiaceae bacterium]|nr:GNAT family N-acetyltransferase [Candidatus Deferrimicrobiaceae bacterium]
MIRRLGDADFQTILSIVNEAAVAYRGKIPADCCKTPYMSQKELEQEIRSGVQFYGYIENGEVVAVMGIQPVGDVTLIRHAYTLTSHQRRGIGAKLLCYLLPLAETGLILVGTWELASWAIRFYQNHGFQPTTRQQTNRLLRKYWNIPKRQVETSVVLTLDRNTQ